MMTRADQPGHSRFTTSISRFRLRRGCVVLGIAAAFWSLFALFTGGVSVSLAFLHISSHNPRNPIIVSVILLIVAWIIAPAGVRPQTIANDLRWIYCRLHDSAARVWRGWAAAAAWIETNVPAIIAPTAALAIAGGVLLTSIQYGAFVAADSDSFGYVSHAHMWATATLREPQPLMAELRGVLPREAMAPVAFRPSPEGTTIVPVTSPGLPMLMALFELTGGPRAVFAVVPLMAVVAVWATYRLGRELGGRWTGVVAACLLATAPAFLFQLTSPPMSDIPAAALWAVSLTAALRGSTSSALVSGAAAGAAILVRANLAPVAAVPAAIVLFRGTTRRDLVSFAIGILPGVASIALLYTYWYGSPLQSGYGSLPELYSAANIGPNLSRYPRWLVESETPLIAVAIAAPLLVRRRAAAWSLLLFVVAVLTCYIAYIPFDAWWFLRFLLPAFPAVFALLAAALVTLACFLPRQLRVLAAGVILALLSRYTIGYAAARATFDTGGAQKFAIAGRYAAEHLPDNAVIFAELHSGALRYYGHRTTIRFGSIPADHLEGAVAELQRLGYQPYLVAEDWEEEVFRRQFAGRQILAALANGPQVELPLGHVRIYPLTR